MGESSGTALGGPPSVVPSKVSPWLALVLSSHRFRTSARTRRASCCMNSQASSALVPGNLSWTSWMASTAREKSGAMASTRSSIVGRCEYGGGMSRGCWPEAMLLFCQWVKGKSWGFEGHGLVSWSLDRPYFYADLKGDVGGTLSLDPRHARSPPVPTCCPTMDTLST